MRNGYYARRDMISIVDRILTPNKEERTRLTEMGKLVLRIAEGRKKPQTKWTVEVLEDKKR